MLYHNQHMPVWGIPHRCLNESHAQLLHDCLASIRKFYPQHRIIIVDSDSPRKDHFKGLCDKFQATVAPIINRHYECGAWKIVYEEYRASFYCFIHDSCQLNTPIDNIFTENASTLLCVANWECTNETHRDFTRKSLIGTKWEVPDYFVTLVGSIVLAQADVIADLYNNHFFDFLPSNKFESQCCERRIGIALCGDGHTSSLEHNQLGRGPWMSKRWLDRQ